MSGKQSTPAEKKDESSNWAARMTAVLAVIAALSSGRWSASNLQAILEQGKVNDAWSYYQSKSVKEHGLEQTRDLARALATGEPSDRAQALVKLGDSMDQIAAREAKDRAKIMADARDFNKRRNVLVEKSFWLEISFACLQLGVILCTIAAGTEFRFGLPAGIIVGLLGVALMVNGFHTFVHAPASWYQGTGQQMGYEPGN
ncbi:MAG TPA: DUF4337 domain-containing protein [Tepidisphaeraceae bacterium]|nr:DUF4337 domain-containing protein [Tepidisphaeraceae bacterium]